jgi:tetratricopeptide (TPR) repeat protein
MSSAEGPLAAPPRRLRRTSGTILRPVADRTKSQIVLAREHLERREIDRAEQLLLQVLARSDKYADVHHLLAMVAREKGDFVRAALCLERAVAINPRYTEALLALAITYNDLGRYEDSRDIRERLAAKHPGETIGVRPERLDAFVLGRIANQHAGLAQTYRDAGCYEDAERELRRAIELRPAFVDLRVRLAAVLRDAGRVEEAITELEAACARTPRYVEAQVQLGLAFLAAGRREEARRSLRQALELDPDHERARTYARVLGEGQG